MKKWEVSIKEFQTKNGKNKYKVTRRLPDFKVAETKIFDDKNKAKKQFEEWVN